jgi:hypothetical protein
MLALLGYLAAVTALLVGGAFGLMVLLSGSAEIGKNLGAYTDPTVAAPANPRRVLGPNGEASEASRTTGLATAERPVAKEVRPKAGKSRKAKIDKRKKRTAARERR